MSGHEIEARRSTKFLILWRIYSVIDPSVLCFILWGKSFTRLFHSNRLIVRTVLDFLYTPNDNHATFLVDISKFAKSFTSLHFIQRHFINSSQLFRPDDKIEIRETRNFIRFSRWSNKLSLWTFTVRLTSSETASWHDPDGTRQCCWWNGP